MNKFSIWAPLTGALCLIAAAVVIAHSSRRDVKDIYGMLKRYE